MRVFFKHMGQANLYLKTCKLLLIEALNIPEGERLPTQRTRNAVCKGFGYNSYEDLKHFMTQNRQDAFTAPDPEDLLQAFALGFFYAIEYARQCNFQYDEDTEALSLRLAQKAYEIVTTRVLGQQVFVPSSTKQNQQNAKALSAIQEIPGGTLTTEQVAERLGISLLEVDRRREENRLLGLPDLRVPGHHYPAFQFEDSDILKKVERVLKVMEDADPRRRLSFFVSSSPVLNSRTPLEAIQGKGLLEDVLFAASLYAQQSAKR